MIRKAIDLQRFRHSHLEWSSASSLTIIFLDKKVKEQETLYFFKGAIFQYTFNDNGKFSQSQLGLCYDLPS